MFALVLSKYHWFVILREKESEAHSWKWKKQFLLITGLLFSWWFAFSKVLYDDDRARAQKEIATHKKEEERI